MFRVFVSYSTSNLQWATYLKELLTDATATVFVAEHDVAPGRSLSDTISAEIKRCDLFVLLWSRDSVASHYVQSEIFLARSEKKKIVPLLLDRTANLPSILGDLKYLPLDRDPRTTTTWLKKLVQDTSHQQEVSNLIRLALVAFVGWMLLKDSS